MYKSHLLFSAAFQSVLQSCPVIVGCLALFALLQTSNAQVSKGNQILINRGFQAQGLASINDAFHLTTFANANYTTLQWLWDSNPSLMGTAPGFPWSRWAGDETKVPPLGGEGPYMSQLVTLQLGDEWEFNNDVIRQRMIDWLNAIRANFPNTILYANNYGGQVGDAALGDFIARGRPDMISFDTYPFRPPGASYQLVNWYGDCRRYRQHAMLNNIPLSVYMQTYYSGTEGIRSPSPSELRLNASAAMAFNAKVLIDFTYNTGASSLFNNGLGGDNSPNSLYYEKADVNTRARNLGKALVRLKPIADASYPDLRTTGMMFIRGKDTNGVPNPVPIGIFPDDAAPNSYTDWEYQRNDPYLNGWSVANIGTKNNGQPGDVIISWFRVLDESYDGSYANEIYMMVMNGLSDPTGTAADCRQDIKLNFLNSFTAIDMLDPVTGQGTNMVLPIVNSKRQLALNLIGGDAVLFKFSTGAPFVGVGQISQPPVITTQPTSRTVAVGASTTFSVTATGAAPLSYRWRFNGTTIAGATTSSYTRANVQTTNAGSYSVVITNSVGSVTSANAILTVQVAPQITAQPQSRTVLAGSNVLFTVTATGTPAPTYQWRFNAVNISGATLSAYTRLNAQTANAGSYSVVVANVAGSVTSANAVLTVNTLPSITTQPQSQTVAVGSTATFSVTATGTAPLGYQWRFNAAAISGATLSSYARSNAQDANVGSYSVVVSNPYGTVTSANATLQLNHPPTLTLGNARNTEPLVNFESFTNNTPNGYVMFQRPAYSPTTGGFIDTAATNYSSVSTSFPAGNARAAAKVLKAAWTFKTGTTNSWMRFNTFNTTNLANPTIPLDRIVRFDFYTDKSLKVGMGVRETGTTAEYGANGGSTGGIEWLGVTNVIGTSPFPSRVVNAGAWTTLEFNLPAESIRTFTGDGVLASGKGTLEEIPLMPNGGLSAYTIYLDNFEVVTTTALPGTITSANGSTITFTATSTDPDSGQTRTYSLDAGFPTGASINSSSGAFTWTPSNGQINTTNIITVRVRDNGVGLLSDAKTFTVIVKNDPVGVQSAESVGSVSSGEKVKLTWDSVPGRTYLVQYKDSLKASSWKTLTQVTATSTQSSIVVSNGNKNRFYRIVEAPTSSAAE